MLINSKQAFINDLKGTIFPKHVPMILQSWFQQLQSPTALTLSASAFLPPPASDYLLCHFDIILLLFSFPLFLPLFLPLFPSNPPRSRCLLILFQIQQQLPKALLAQPIRSTPSALPTQINELRNPLPARATGTGILTLGQKVSGIGTRQLHRLCALAVVVIVEVVDGGTCCLFGFVLFGSRGFGAMSEGEVTAIAPRSRKGCELRGGKKNEGGNETSGGEIRTW